MSSNETLQLLEEIAQALDTVTELASKLDDVVLGKSIISDIEPVSCCVVNELKEATFGWQVV
tara:strand:+ start:672 stop:857 length:186 start_codon:yes stop_codon:yes gene_type:complete